MPSGDAVGTPRRMQFLADLASVMPKPCGGVLAVDHHEVELQLRDQAGEVFCDGGPAGLADHVAEEEKAHQKALKPVSSMRKSSLRS